MADLQDVSVNEVLAKLSADERAFLARHWGLKGSNRAPPLPPQVADGLVEKGILARRTPFTFELTPLGHSLLRPLRELLEAEERARTQLLIYGAPCVEHGYPGCSCAEDDERFPG